MECEICGAEDAGYVIIVEGARLTVCEDCSFSGKIIKRPQAVREYTNEASVSRAREELEVVEGYGRRIAAARKEMGLPLQVLAEKLNEKLSFLERVEHEKTLPDEKLARKLERELGIVLLESNYEAEKPSNDAKGSGKGLTLGDVIEIEQKKKKE